jgi:hypothetical protein
MNKYFGTNESLVANELWDLLSGEQNTMEEILAIINSISTTSFLEKFQFLSDGANRIKPAYLLQLTEWHLYSEIELIKNNATIIRKIANNKVLTRIYNKNSLDSKGNFSWDRYNDLRQLF